jgi:hypothetical protein
MKQKLIIDTQTATILNIEHCYIIEANELSDDDFTSSELQMVADRCGQPVRALDDHTEEQALELMWSLVRRFGWKGTMFTRQDVRQTVIDHCGERPTLDNYVEAIMASRMWVKHLDEAMCREGYECLYDAIREVSDNE